MTPVNCVHFVSGTNHDVGETLVKTLQNTRYSIDEKLEQSFINLFGSKRLSGSVNNGDDMTCNSLKSSQQSSESEIGKDLGKVSISEQADTDHINGDGVSEQSDSDGSDEESDYAPVDQHENDEQSPFEYELKEKVEYHGGRSRRKAISSKDEDGDDLEVCPETLSLLLTIFWFYFFLTERRWLLVNLVVVLYCC